MTRARLAGAACLLFIAITASWICCTRTRISPLQRYYTDLVRYYDPSKLPKLEDVSKVLNQVPDARPGEITNALPAIMAAFAHRDETVKAYACTALFAIGRRPDSAELLNQYTDVLIQDVSATSNPNIRAGEITILGGLRPAPPPQVVSSFLAFLKRTDIGVQAQGSGVIFELVQIAPDNPEVIAAIREFLSRQLDSTTRIGALNALGNPNVKDVGLIAVVITSLDDSDQGVRFTAAQVLGRMGKNALLQGEPALQRLANDPKQPANVTAAAKEALKGIPGPTN
jgi:HEAT repeat protein